MMILSSLKNPQRRAHHRKSNLYNESDHASAASGSEAFYSCIPEMSSLSSIQLSIAFECSSNFYPEKYTMDERIQSDVFVLAKLRAWYNGVRSDLYWLHLAKPARR